MSAFLSSKMKTIEVVAAIIVRDGEVFCTQRGYGEWQGWWEFPGGKVEPGESDECCLAREMNEEFGISGCTREPVCESRYVYGAQGRAILLCAYVFEWLSGEIELRVHDAVCWATAQELSLLCCDYSIQAV